MKVKKDEVKTALMRLAAFFRADVFTTGDSATSCAYRLNSYIEALRHMETERLGRVISHLQMTFTPTTQNPFPPIPAFLEAVRGSEVVVASGATNREVTLFEKRYIVRWGEVWISILKYHTRSIMQLGRRDKKFEIAEHMGQCPQGWGFVSELFGGDGRIPELSNRLKFPCDREADEVLVTPETDKYGKQILSRTPGELQECIRVLDAWDSVLSQYRETEYYRSRAEEAAQNFQERES